jgi:hypothetical protein
VNRAKVTDHDYLQFLLAAQRVYSCTEAAQCQSVPVTHDAFTRLLSRMPPDTEALWQDVEPLMNKQEGLLVLDDTTLDKPHAKKMELVTRHWSGKHHQVVSGINLLTLLWTDGSVTLPCDCSLYTGHLPGGETKNQAFARLLQTASARGFAPAMVCFDSWYSSLDNLKLVRLLGWHFLTRLKSNRQVNPDGAGNRAVCDISIEPDGSEVHLKGFGFVKVFRIVDPHGNTQHWATSDLSMSEQERQRLATQVFSIENYHRGLKQCCGVERCFARLRRSQTNHILLAIRAFVRLETNRIQTGISWYAAKLTIVRRAIADYLAQPTLLLKPTA